MKTKLLYLANSYQKTMIGKVIEVVSGNPGTYKLTLDQTVFYPIGGGQASDQGKLTNEEWDMKVIDCAIQDSEHRHIVRAAAAPEIGLELTGEIDWDRRYKLMKIHSAGHVIDFAMFILGHSPKTLMPWKGDHGKKAFIQYHGKLDKDIKAELEAKANELIQKNLAISSSFSDLVKLQKEAIYLQPGLPTNKPLRQITLEGVGSVADGGTQVKATGEIGKVEILAVETLGDETIVRYRIV
jgi:Ser-tRNA(Ala) deacylase AlaX